MNQDNSDGMTRLGLVLMVSGLQKTTYLTQEAWDKIGTSESPWGANEPSNWRTNQQIPWHMRHLFREDEFSGNQPEQINEPDDYAYYPETTLQDWVDTWE